MKAVTALSGAIVLLAAMPIRAASPPAQAPDSAASEILQNISEEDEFQALRDAHEQLRRVLEAEPDRKPADLTPPIVEENPDEVGALFYDYTDSVPDQPVEARPR